jgi:hypothetical protein
MGEPKPLASLSSSLLARKGQAKPAMRPQGFGGFGTQFNGQDDLGWNDMGHDLRHPVPIHQDVHPQANGELPQVVLQREELVEELNLAPEDFHAPEMLLPIDGVEAIEDEPAYAEPVIELQPVARKFTKKPVQLTEERPVQLPAERTVPIVAVKRAHKAAKARKGAKAAFTLRLDPERHLKLRLACALGRESAQSIVTEALDRFLAELPDVEALARKVPGSAH